MFTRKEPALYNFLINSKGYSLLIFPVYPYGFDRCKSFSLQVAGFAGFSLVYSAGFSCLFAREELGGCSEGCSFAREEFGVGDLWMSKYW